MPSQRRWQVPERQLQERQGWWRQVPLFLAPVKDTSHRRGHFKRYLVCFKLDNRLVSLNGIAL
jgi:hypothetical protein